MTVEFGRGIGTTWGVDYNPNHVATQEMTLLLRSIRHDGYTQPIVTIWNPERGKYEIVDGFHRFMVMQEDAAVLESCGGRLPVVVLEKSVNDRMASTVRHNRARGKHSVVGMSSMVFTMLENGMQDAEICNELGMEPEELLRLKHVTGFSKLFEGTEYSRAWVTKSQVRIRLKSEEQASVQKRLAAEPHAGVRFAGAPPLPVDSGSGRDTEDTSKA